MSTLQGRSNLSFNVCPIKQKRSEGLPLQCFYTPHQQNKAQKGAEWLVEQHGQDNVAQQRAPIQKVLLCKGLLCPRVART